MEKEENRKGKERKDRRIGGGRDKKKDKGKNAKDEKEREPS
jgi:hypothetical protein